MIAVTGASGHLGSEVIDNLLKAFPASHIVAVVRNPPEAQAMNERGVVVRHGDYDNPDSLRTAFDAVGLLLLISSSGIEHERRFAQHRRAIDAAQHAGVKHVYYTSLLPGAASVAYVMKAHLDTEAYLKTCGMSYTIIKNGVYIEAHQQYLGPEISGEIAIPADGPISWVSRSDLAEGIARLIHSGGYRNETVYLTGAVALDIEALCRLIGLRRGVPLRRNIVPVEDYVARLTAAGYQADFATKWATTYLDLPHGEFGRVDPLLEELLGRQPKSVENVLGGL